MMNMKLLNLFLPVFTFVFILSGCASDSEEELYPGSTACDTTDVTYSKSLAPVFAANCNSCHSGDNPTNNIRTDNYSSVKTNISRIHGAINREPGFSAMPQDGAKLSDCDLKKIDIWIADGMPDN
jgi:cytochrome c5